MRGGRERGWGRVEGRGEPFSEPEAQQRRYTQSIQPGGHIVEDDAPAFRKALERGRGTAW